MNDPRMFNTETYFRYYNPVLSNESYFKYWRVCAAMGPVFLAAFIICWGVLGSNIPPIPADFTADQMAQHFRTNYNEVRAGMSARCCSDACTCRGPWRSTRSCS